jgi:hypothetical protein
MTLRRFSQIEGILFSTPSATFRAPPHPNELLRKENRETEDLPELLDLPEDGLAEMEHGTEAFTP